MNWLIDQSSARRAAMMQTSVMAVTERFFAMRETQFVDVVQRVCTNALLEPGDTRQQWKGEAAASFVLLGSPVAVYYRPPVPATGPRFYLV
jgi:hypothetical protein